MSVTLYGFWRSLAAFRVRAALNYKEIPFTEKIIDLVQGDQFSEDYHALNPQHVIPLLEHDGKNITQSLAIKAETCKTSSDGAISRMTTS